MEFDRSMVNIYLPRSYYVNELVVNLNQIEDESYVD